MKRFAIIFFTSMLILSLAGCSGGRDVSNGTDPSQSEGEQATPEFHYTGDLYDWDFTQNDYQGAYVLIEGLPWEEFPEELPLIGGYMDLGLGGGGPTQHSDRQSLHVFTRGGDDGEAANWYRQQLEAAAWEVTDFEISEQYGSTRFNFSNDNWTGNFRVESEEASLGGYDGAMERSESDFEKTAVTISISPRR